MIDAKIVKQIKHAPVPERIRIIEEIIQSLKQDMKKIAPTTAVQAKPFKVRQFNLGTNIFVDRDLIYSERVP